MSFEEELKAAIEEPVRDAEFSGWEVPFRKSLQTFKKVLNSHPSLPHVRFDLHSTKDGLGLQLSTSSKFSWDLSRDHWVVYFRNIGGKCVYIQNGPFETTQFTCEDAHGFQLWLKAWTRWAVVHWAEDGIDAYYADCVGAGEEVFAELRGDYGRNHLFLQIPWGERVKLNEKTDEITIRARVDDSSLKAFQKMTAPKIKSRTMVPKWPMSMFKNPETVTEVGEHPPLKFEHLSSDGRFFHEVVEVVPVGADELSIKVKLRG
jgi:hypothetical protein